MRKTTVFVLGVALALVVALGLTRFATTDLGTARAAEAEQPAVAPQAVEDDMHELMEYAFAFPYERLGDLLLEAPEKSTQWKAVKGDALTLAELSNLLIARPPEAKPDEWKQTAAAVRTAGGELYRAAKAKDYATARRHYEVMIEACNACHKAFQTGITIEP